MIFSMFNSKFINKNARFIQRKKKKKCQKRLREQEEVWHFLHIRTPQIRNDAI